MRKNYFYSLFLFVFGLIQAQEKNNPVQLNELLNRLNAVGNTTEREPDGLFTPAEETILQDYFSNRPGFNNSEMALGDNYLLNIRANPRVFGTIPATGTGPYTITQITTFTDAYYAGDFTSAGVLYGFNAVGITLDVIDITSGAITTGPAITNLPTGHNITGLSWNHTNSTMYAMSSNGTISTLYTIDLSTGALTSIGNTGTALGIWVAINSTGAAYMADAATDSLYSVNLTTGVATLIGALGINLNFAQGADFDSSTDTLYMAAYVGAGVNQYCSINTTTGAATQLGTINANNAECDIAAIYRNNLSVNEVNAEAGLSLYPNPAASYVNLVSNSNVEMEKVFIYDMSGRLIKEINLGSVTEHTINTADLSSGMYTLMIQTPSGKFSKKLSKK